jgi:hypothetical protein
MKKQKMKESVVFEKVPLVVLYSQNGRIGVNISKNTNPYMLYGFLRLYLNVVEDQLYQDMYQKKESFDEDNKRGMV